jgi:hypothetical protein
MDDLDFNTLTAEQEKLLREMLEICDYLCLSQRNNLLDSTYAEQAKVLGSKFQRLQEVRTNR